MRACLRACVHACMPACGCACVHACERALVPVRSGLLEYAPYVRVKCMPVTHVHLQLHRICVHDMFSNIKFWLLTRKFLYGCAHKTNGPHMHATCIILCVCIAALPRIKDDIISHSSKRQQLKEKHDASHLTQLLEFLDGTWQCHPCCQVEQNICQLMSTFISRFVDFSVRFFLYSMHLTILIVITGAS